MKYLLVTGIPFERAANGNAVLDSLWAEDLKGLAAAAGELTVAAPEAPVNAVRKWGPAQTELTAADKVTFVRLPFFRNKIGAMHKNAELRAVLRREVQKADLVHSSNFFPPHEGLAFAHAYASSIGKKTLFVVAEDFYDFMHWNARLRDASPLSRMREERLIERLDALCRKCLATASLAFLHTPAAVARYASCTPRALAIRQPVHELDDIVTDAVLDRRIGALQARATLRLVMAVRLEALKGVDFLLRAASLLQKKGVPLEISIFGEGRQREALERLSNYLALQQCVVFEGGVAPGRPLRERLEQGHIFAMPHLTNDFGRAFWDGMAAGLPVIAFRTAASQDTVRHRLDGMVVPMADVKGLADAILELHEDRPLLVQMTQAAQKRARENTKSQWMQIRMDRIRELVDSSQA